MKVFSLSLGQDTGGQAIRLKEAWDRHAPDGDGFRAMASTVTYIDYPRDLPYHARTAQLYYSEADVAHLHNRLDAHDMFDQGTGKPVLLHHHGSVFRGDHEAIANAARRAGAVQMVSTIDLEVLEPDVTWLPAPFDLDYLAGFRDRYYRPGERVRIAHAPTNRAAKNTDLILAALARVGEEYPIEVDLIERVTWAECLERKARADIFIDQIAYGYGNNAVEAWAMGIPVISGVTDSLTRDRMLELWGGIPFVEASSDTIGDVIVRLVKSRAAREEGGAMGLEHSRRYHAAERVVPLLRQIYADAPATRPGRVIHRHRWRPNVPRPDIAWRTA